MNVQNTKGFTLVELLFVVGVISILSAMAAPALSRTRTAANQASAIASLRVIHSAEQMFWASCGNGNFAPSLLDLRFSAGGAQGYISPDLFGDGNGNVRKSGYDFFVGSENLSPGQSCNGSGLSTGYYAVADPLPGNTGGRYFGTNAGGGILLVPGDAVRDHARERGAPRTGRTDSPVGGRRLAACEPRPSRPRLATARHP